MASLVQIVEPCVFSYKGKMIEIKNVWAHNLEEEMARMREVARTYKFVAMDTEFPGVVARPIGSFTSATDFQYQTLRCNVDLLKIIQLGISFADEDGNFPEGVVCWQFNFRFSLSEDMFARDSIDLLTRSGINFKKHEDYGIDVESFGEALMSSGLILVDDVRWISFHSGYDFGYLIKLLTCKPLPAHEEDFFLLLHTYFPCVFDEKHMMRDPMCNERLRGGLNKLAEDLNVKRVGAMHQAGSDSLVTLETYFQLCKDYFKGDIDNANFVGVLHGLGAESSMVAQ